MAYLFAIGTFLNDVLRKGMSTRRSTDMQLQVQLQFEIQAIIFQAHHWKVLLNQFKSN